MNIKKVHNENKLQWLVLLQGVLFAYRTSQHASTKFSPFFVLYQRDPVLPVDLTFHSMNDTNVEEFDFGMDFDEVTFEKTLDHMVLMRANFTSPTDHNLLVAKSNRIEISLVTEEGLQPIEEIAIYDNIEIMKVFRPKHKDNDLLFVVTAQYNAMILECVQTESGDIEIITRAHGNISDHVRKISVIGAMAVIDPSARVIALKFHDGLFKIIPLDKEGELKAYCLRMEEVEVQYIDFLYGCANPTIIIIHQDQCCAIAKFS